MGKLEQSKRIELYTKDGKRLYMYSITTGQYSDWSQEFYISEIKYTQAEIKKVYDEWVKIKKDHDTAVRAAIKKAYGSERVHDRLKDPNRQEKDKKYMDIFKQISSYFNKKAGFTEDHLEGYWAYFPDFICSRLDLKGFDIQENFDYEDN